MKRVGSKGTLGDTGGSATELTIRFFAKTALLVACVYVLSEKAESIPRLPLELLYGTFAILGASCIVCSSPLTVHACCVH